MLRKNKEIIGQRSRGFTLAELLVVVAIIAVLVTVVVPVFAKALEKGKEAACMANRRSLKAEVTETLLTEPTAEAVSSGSSHSLSTEQSREYTCPEGGTITYWVDKVKGVDVLCSKHSQLSKETMEGIYKVVETTVPTIDSIDSTAGGDFINHTKVKQALKDAGFDLDAMGIKTWKITGTTKRIFQWSTKDISSLKVGDKVLVMQYNPDYGYTVWEAKVKLSKTGSYNIITDVKTDRKEFTKELNETDKRDFDAIKAIYNENAVEYDVPPLL